MKILIIDQFSEAHLSAFSALGLTVEYKPQIGADELPDAMADASIVVARSKEAELNVDVEKAILNVTMWNGSVRRANGENGVFEEVVWPVELSKQIEAGLKDSHISAHVEKRDDGYRISGFEWESKDDYFNIDDDGVVVVLRVEVSENDRGRVEEAARSCPVSALRVEDQ